MKRYYSFSKEFKRRIAEQKEKESVVGSEVKIKRIELNKTQSYVADGICSIAYISRLEANDGKPNEHFSDICDKINMNPKAIDDLYELSNDLEVLTNAFYHFDDEAFASELVIIKDFKNYRATLLKFICFLYKKDLKEAYDYYDRLLPLIKTMYDTDLTYFSLFSGIFHYLGGSFREAQDDLLALVDIKLTHNQEMLRDIYLLFIDLRLSNLEAIKNYFDIHDKLINEALYQYAEEISYYFCLFLAKNKVDNLYNLILKRITKKEYINTIIFYYEFFNNNKIMDFNSKEINDFSLAVIRINNYSKKAASKALLDNSSITRLDFEYYILEYLMVPKKQRREYIINNIPVYKEIGDKFLNKYFMSELVKISSNTKIYKDIRDYYDKIFLENY